MLMLRFVYRRLANPKQKNVKTKVANSRVKERHVLKRTEIRKHFNHLKLDAGADLFITED
jgi:hypothetical protein